MPTTLRLLFFLAFALPAQAQVPGTPDVDGDPRGGDQFGDALTTGDFDGDGYADLAIGIQDAQVSGRSRTGAATVLYGSTSVSARRT